jgi:hypothetical protein
MLTSLLRCSVRSMLKPQVSLFGLKLNVRNGSSTSSVQPVSIRRARPVQMPSVGHRAFGIHLEEIAGAGVEKGVDRPPDLVVGAERLIAATLLADDRIRLGVVRHHTEIQGIAVERDSYVGAFGRRLTVVRIDLDEIPRGLRARPDSLVQAAVDLDRLVIRQPRGCHHPPAAIGGARLLRGGGVRVAVLRRHQRRGRRTLRSSRGDAHGQRGNSHEEPEGSRRNTRHV